MASESVIDQIVKSLSFEVEATPQEDERIQTTSTSNITPLNVKIRVRKKHESNVEKAMLSVPKFGNPYGAPERVRLISSDQTIMSFNVLMEANYVKRGKKRFRKYLFGGCLGTQYDDNDGPYVPSSTYKAETAEENIISKSEAVIKENLSLSKNQQGHINPIPPFKNHSVLGKCKPGGCLDPPFGEDKYSYKPVNKNEILVKSAPKPEVKKKTANNKGIKKSNVIGNKNGDSIISLYETDKLHDSIDSKYSDAIITYPPQVTSSTNINGKLVRTKIFTDEKQRRSIVEGSEVFYSPAKSYHREESKEINISDKLLSHAYINKESTNSQNLATQKTDIETTKLNSTDASTQEIQDFISNKPVKLLNRISVDPILQGNKKHSHDILYNQKTEMKPNRMNENLDLNSLTFLSSRKSLKNNENNTLDNSLHNITLAHEKEQISKRTCTSDEKSNSYFSISDNINSYDILKSNEMSASVSITKNYAIDETSQQFTKNKLNQFDDYIYTSHDAVNNNITTTLIEPAVPISGKDNVSEKSIIDKNARKDYFYNHNIVNDTIRKTYFDPSLSYEKIDLMKEEVGQKSSKDFLDINGIKGSSTLIDQRDHNESKSNPESTTTSNKEFNLPKMALRSFSSNELKHFDNVIGKDSIDINTILDNKYYGNINKKLEESSNSYPISDPLVTNKFDKQDPNEIEKSYTTTNQEKPALSSEIGNLQKFNLKIKSTEQFLSSERTFTYIDSNNKNGSILSKGSGSISTSKTYKLKAENSNKKILTDPFNKVIDKTEFRHIKLGRSSEQNTEFNDTKELSESYLSYNITHKDEQMTNPIVNNEAKENDPITVKKEFEEVKNNQFESNRKSETYFKIPTEREATNDENSSSPHNNESFDKLFYHHHKSEPNRLSTDSYETKTSKNILSNRASFQKEDSQNMSTPYDKKTASIQESSSNSNTENDSITTRKKIKEPKNNEFENNEKNETRLKKDNEQEQYPKTKDFYRVDDENCPSSHNNESFDKTFYTYHKNESNRLSTDNYKIITPKTIINNRASFQKEASQNIPNQLDNRNASHKDITLILNTRNDSIRTKTESKEDKNNEFENNEKNETRLKKHIEQEQYPKTKVFYKAPNDGNGTTPHNNESFDKIFYEHYKSEPNRLSTYSNKIITPKTIISNSASFQKEATGNITTCLDGITSDKDISLILNTDNDSIRIETESKEANNNECENNEKNETSVKIPIKQEQYPETKDFYKATNDEIRQILHNNESFDKILYQHYKSEPNRLSTGSYKIITPKTNISNRASFQIEASRDIPTHFDIRTTSHEDISSILNTEKDLITSKTESQEAISNEFESNGRTETQVEIPIEREQYNETQDFHNTTNDENGSSPHNNESFNKTIYHHNKSKFNILSTDSYKIITPKNIINNSESIQNEASQNKPTHDDNRTTSREDSSLNLNTHNYTLTAQTETKEAKNKEFGSNGKTKTQVKIPIEQYNETKHFHKETNYTNGSSPHNNKSFDKTFYQHNKTKPNILSTDSDITSKNITPRNLISNRESLQQEASRNMPIHYDYKSSFREDSSSNLNAVDGSYRGKIEHPNFKPAHTIKEQAVSYIDPRLRSSNTNNEIILFDNKTANLVKILKESNDSAVVDKDRNNNKRDSAITPASPIQIDVHNPSTKYPNISAKNGTAKNNNILSEESAKMSGLKVPLQYYSHKNSNAAKSLDDVRCKTTTSKAYLITFDKFHENHGFTEEYDLSKSFKDSIASRKSSVKNEVISLNMGFKSYTNAKRERILETTDASKEPVQRSNNDIVTCIKAQIWSHVNDIRIPIDSENEMSIQIRRSKSPPRVKVQTSGQLHQDKSSLKFLQNDEAKLTDKEIGNLFDSVYERDLIPLQKAFKYLKQDVATLAYQQSKFKDKAIGPKKSKSIRLVKVNPKCCCCWKK